MDSQTPFFFPLVNPFVFGNLPHFLLDPLPVDPLPVVWRFLKTMELRGFWLRFCTRAAFLLLLVILASTSIAVVDRLAYLIQIVEN
jgi:hypothetical protein